MDYRLPIRRRPVTVVKKTVKLEEIEEKNEETEQVSTDNVIHLSISDSVNTEESFGG